MHKITRHLQHYLPLVGILVAGILGFTIFSYDEAFQVAIIFATTAGYVAWGLIHHYIHKDLFLLTFLEYIVIAVLGIVIVLSILFRS